LSLITRPIPPDNGVRKLRRQRRSVIITSNLGFADWTQVFGEPTLTAALLDRLTHKAHIVTCDWESFRLQESLKVKGGANKEKGEASLGREKVHS
jgi:hypothetical protein